MIFYIADTHFGHANIMRIDKRPFSDVHEMDEYMIFRWNERVNPDDNIYVVGDFSYKGINPPESYLRRLKGKKHLLIGNHDIKLLKNKAAMSYFETVNDILTIQDGNNQVVLCHYPLIEWPHYYRNAYHVYGHIHNNNNKANLIMAEEERALNAGVMLNNYSPSSLNELINNKKYSNNYSHKK